MLNKNVLTDTMYLNNYIEMYKTVLYKTNVNLQPRHLNSIFITHKLISCLFFPREAISLVFSSSIVIKPVNKYLSIKAYENSMYCFESKI